ncbi:MAG: class I SAM-dependent methyltransferase [Hyphomicrobium sp.]|uniref:class I SAM-dependent methyltransferase n=1 Tax=Hyphomicrobium sp. TaxID=82 RepID=UPI0039E36AEF
MGVITLRGVLKRLSNAKGAAAGKYTDLVLDEKAIARGDYKQHLGGGSEGWDARGRFQLELLRAGGLQTSSNLLDIGCGPLRAGVHFIRYLDAGHYYGFDYNPSFVSAGQRLIAENSLEEKRPTIVALANFELKTIDRIFDHAIAFSVLNHCNEAQRSMFFANIGRCLAPAAKLFISHANWLKEEDLGPARLAILRRFEAADLNLGQYGWPPEEQRSVCPIYELGRLPD